MADEAVGAGGDDFLIGRDFDGRRGEAVFAEDEEDEVEAEGDEAVGRDGEEGRDGGPVKAAVESGEGDEQGEEGGGERLDDFLAAAFFGGGAGAEAALDEVWVALEEVGGNQEGRCEVDRREEPRLPEIERPGGDEEEQSRVGRSAWRRRGRFFGGGWGGWGAWVLLMPCPIIRAFRNPRGSPSSTRRLPDENHPAGAKSKRCGSSEYFFPTFVRLIAKLPSSKVVSGICQYDPRPSRSVELRFLVFSSNQR